MRRRRETVMKIQKKHTVSGVYVWHVPVQEMHIINLAVTSRNELSATITNSIGLSILFSASGKAAKRGFK